MGAYASVFSKRISRKGQTVEKVVAGRCEDYSREKLKGFLGKALGEINVDLANARVLLKPNLVMGKPPEKAVNTHPQFVGALAELLLDRSCQIFIGDSPGYESTEKALKNSGIMTIIEYYGLTIAKFDSKILRKSGGVSPYREFVLGEDPGMYDAVINLPKLKTHGMTGITCGVKNTFGFVPGLEKARWHLRGGQDRLRFASILIDIHNLVKPSVTIVDGILAMDREGPTSGRPRQIGLVGLSRNAFALDRSMERFLGIDRPLPISFLAERHGFLPGYDLVDFGAPSVHDFEIPAAVATDWNLPSLAKKVLRNALIRKPKLAKEGCKGCGVCVDICPGNAIDLADSRPRFDYGRCIRCYCCQEMCPEGAIRI
jgi:uncharacterized protein (DUF362 family)/Pyruvate/2-oxoacid:ferredoxin oxidoreductase delta subunit